VWVLLICYYYTGHIAQLCLPLSWNQSNTGLVNALNLSKIDKDIFPVFVFYEFSDKNRSKQVKTKVSFKILFQVKSICCCWGPAQFTHNIFAHNIEIKRNCNKKIKRHFSSNIFSVWMENIYFWTIMLIET